MNEPVVESLAEVRSHLDEVMDRAHREGTPTIITRRGRREAVVIGIDEYRRLRRIEEEAPRHRGTGSERVSARRHFGEDQRWCLVFPQNRTDEGTASRMRIAVGDDWSATVTVAPLDIIPRFDFWDLRVRIAMYADVEERERFLLKTFGSGPWLWDTPDELRFDPLNRELAGAELQMPGVEAAGAEDSARVPAVPPVHPGGLRADEARDCHLEVTTELCRAPGDAELTCLRDLDVLDEPLQARVGIAPDVALLVQHGTVVGWSLADPARYLTTGFAAPDLASPAPATRRLFTECMDLITTSLLDGVRDRDPAALARLRELERALRAQSEDRHRVDALLSLIGALAEDYGNW